VLLEKKDADPHVVVSDRRQKEEKVTNPNVDFDDLRRKLDEPRPESYRFETQGQELLGTVTGLDIGTTWEGERVRIVVVDAGDDGPPHSVWLLHDALKSQMTRLRPQPGDRIGIRYNGKETGKSGRSYHSYTVVTDRQAAAFTWDETGTPSVPPEWFDDEGVPLPPEPADEN